MTKVPHSRDRSRQQYSDSGRRYAMHPPAQYFSEYTTNARKGEDSHENSAFPAPLLEGKGAGRPLTYRLCFTRSCSSARLASLKRSKVPTR